MVCYQLSATDGGLESPEDLHEEVHDLCQFESHRSDELLLRKAKAGKTVPGPG